MATESDTATTPTLEQYADAAFRASFDGSIHSGLTPLKGSNGAVKSFKTKDGFAAKAFLTKDDQLVVAYCGTDFKQILTRPEFVANQIIADYDIYQGKNPAAYKDGEKFIAHAEAVAQSDGITLQGNVFVAGHSLGGAIAAYVSANEAVPGTTFAAPGLAPGDIPSGADQTSLTAYVEKGDPIGNFGSNPNYESSFLRNDGITRFGDTQDLGSEVDRGLLIGAGFTYDGSESLGLLAFAGLALAHHPLTDYASDLGLPSPTKAKGNGNITSTQLVQFIEKAISGTGDVGPKQSGSTETTTSQGGATVSLDDAASYVGQGSFVLTGKAASPAGVGSVEISASVDGTTTDLGAAAVNPDGTFSFTDQVGAHTQGFITATLTDAAGNTATATPATSLQAGLQGGSFEAKQESYSADGSAGTSTAYQMSNGHRRVVTEAANQTLSSNFGDVFDNAAAEGTTFVFRPGYGNDIITGLSFAGSNPDKVSLPSADFASFAQVLQDTQNTPSGALIHDNVSGDTLLLAGISKAQLAQHRADFSFHA